jgi:transposase
MQYYIGLDVSQKQTAICVVDEQGKIIEEGKSLTRPTDIYDWLHARQIEFSSIVRIGLEAGALSSWLCAELTKLGLPMICLETFQAHRFLKTYRNKTDKNDARGLAQLVRMGGEFIRPVTVRGRISQEDRMLLTMRQQLVRQKVGLENNITGSLKPFGLIVPRGNISRKTFRDRVLAALDKADEMGLKLREGILPSLGLYEDLCKHLTIMTRQVEGIARNNPTCRRLMTAPGVGPIVALSFVTAVDNPHRFSKNEDIGAYFGLTPRQFQSGDTDYKTNISRRGNPMTRVHLVQAATVLLISSRKWSTLRAWGMKIAKKRGMNKARIAVARKLAIVLHRMWINEQDFHWTNKTEAKELAVPAPA